MKKFIVIFSFIIIFQFFVGLQVDAASCTCGGRPASYEKDACCKKQSSEKCVWDEGCGSEGKSGGKMEPVKLDNPIKVESPQVFIGIIIKSLLGVVGSLALLMFIWGGFIWMTAAGNSEKVTKGMQTLMWASVGLIVIFSSYALVSFIIENIGAK